MDYTQFKADDIWLQTINPSFDPSMHELMAPLMVGGSIALIGGSRKLDSREITDAIIRHQATHITSVPTMLTLLASTPNFSECTSLKHVCVGGEVFRPALGQKVLSLLPNTTFHNVYGPTEATIMASGWKITTPEARDALPIGPAIYNMKFYIENDEGSIQEALPGREGQLCISGVSLALGYVNDESLTAEKFIVNPLEPDPSSLYHRLYFSGDRCRVDEEGEIYCLGRLDDQVKIHGQRVELAEIEFQFSTFESVHDVAAVLIDGDLIVALVPNEAVKDETLWLQAIKAQALKKLSPIMIPKRMSIIKTVPRQAVSAKADRKKLIEILTASSCNLEQLVYSLETETATAIKETLLPQSIEAKVTEIVLGIIKLGEDIDLSSSFADLGFDSIDLQVLSLKMNEQFHCDLRTEDLFEYYTIEKLSAFIESDTAMKV
jgi:acyl-coenzyme A synthetase/AMP-(fatty) acid ligase/acyl carrier protein